MENKDIEQLAASLLKAPVTFIRGFSGHLSMKPPPDLTFPSSASSEALPTTTTDSH